MTRLMAWKMAGAVLLLCAAAVTVQAQVVFNTLASFSGTNGANPYFGPLVQGRDGNFYGTTLYYGHHACNYGGCGTVFKVTPGGVLTNLHLFCANRTCADGAQPSAGLVLGVDGSFYGTTSAAGANSAGTVFKITRTGMLTTIYAFCAEPNCADGGVPSGNLLLAADGNFYGTTTSGGTGFGTIFKITPSGTLTTLSEFDDSDGSNPFAGLTQTTDGSFYGTTQQGGTYGFGTTFRITQSGVLTLGYSFCSLSDCYDGAYPYAALLQASDGNFYGTTTEGGVGSGEPNIGAGTVFEMAPNGVVKTLYSFCIQSNCGDGFFPAAGLIQATDGNLYGSTVAGGAHGSGEIFRFASQGKAPEIVYNFCSQADCKDGGAPWGELLQATNGILYGTTSGGYGTVFSLNTGLRPFVAFVQAAGKVGQQRGILRQGFTGTTAVSFNGIAAVYTVVSDTYITATVPAGASTGYVTVTTPSGTLTSNIPFHVITVGRK
jgi:uncharacterized repeat protein (TIGR03803 family)